eukprot:312792-Pyramimonas_sp.AAC.1
MGRSGVSAISRAASGGFTWLRGACAGGGGSTVTCWRSGWAMWSACWGCCAPRSPVFRGTIRSRPRPAASESASPTSSRMRCAWSR